MSRLSSITLVIGLIGLPGCVIAPPADAAVDVSISVGVAPPPLLVYEQPLAPAPGYLWTPGYWAWSPDGYYYWVPGTWVLPPQVGLLWTPGWWGWSDGYYRWHPGYWGPQVGFYGGIDYGYGYFGRGYDGGRWRGNQFYYNTAVNRVNVNNFHNTYVDRTVIVNNTTVNRVSYNGGRGGVMVQPTAAQRALNNEHRFAPTPMQARHVQTAMHDPAQRFQRDRALPVVAATPRSANFSGAGVERPQGQPRGRARNAAESDRGLGAQQAPRPPSQQPRGLGGAPQRFEQPAEQGRMQQRMSQPVERDRMQQRMPQQPARTEAFPERGPQQRPPQAGNMPPRFERPSPLQSDDNAARMNQQRRATMEREQARGRAAEQAQARERMERAAPPRARQPEAPRRGPEQRGPERRLDQDR
jgi:hypothetical protein